jgi:hypothetical protein
MIDEKKHQNDAFRGNIVFEGIQRVWGETLTKAFRKTVRMELRIHVET